MLNSKPCSHCLETLKDYGIKTVYYSSDKTMVKEKVNQMETTHISSGNKRKRNECKHKKETQEKENKNKKSNKKRNRKN